MNGAPLRILLGTFLPRLTLATLLLLIALSSPVAAQYCTPDQCDECNLRQCSQRCCYELPELWLINTRCAPRCSNLDEGFECLIYKRYDRECCRWVVESRESFLAQEATKPSLFYVHGNSLNHKNAMKSCWLIYCKMRCCPGPKRLVFWSWPAERVYKTQGLRVREMIQKNLRIKYVYAEYQGYYMAKLVHQMSLTQRVMLSGHSYGGITSAAALHYLGGGCLRGLTFEGGAPVERANLRAGIISGAFDNDMLIPGHRYGQSFIAGEKIYVTRNINDRTLKKWPKTSWRGRQAIGTTGVNANCLGEYYNKLCQQTMYPDVGTSHYLKPHLQSARFVSALCCLSFPECLKCNLARISGEKYVGTSEDSAAEEELVPELDPSFVDDEQLDEQLPEVEQVATEEEIVVDETSFEVVVSDHFGLGLTEPVSFDELSLLDDPQLSEDRLVALLESDTDTQQLFEPESLLDELVEQEVQAEAEVAVEPIAPTKKPKKVVAKPQSLSEPKVAANPSILWYQCSFGFALVCTAPLCVLLCNRMTSA